MTHIQLWQQCLRCLQYAVPFVVLGMVVGFAASIPINFAIDAEALQVKWFGGGISGFERFADLRNRTFFTMLFFGGMFFLTALACYLRAHRKPTQETPE